MNLIASKWAWSMTTHKATERLVLLALASRANKQFTCWPSQKRIAADTGLNIKTVASALKSLSTQTLILDAGRVASRGGFVKRYRLNVALKPQPKKTEKVLETMECDMSEISSKTYRARIDSAPELEVGYEVDDTPKTTEGGGKNGFEDGPESGVLNNISKNKYKNNKKKVYKKKFSPKSKHFDFSKLPKSVDQSAVQNFIDHRQALNAPLTQHALEIQMREAAQAASIGLTPSDVIDQTIGAGWKSINLTWLQNRTQPKDMSANKSCWETYDPFDTSWLRAEDLEVYVHGD